MSLFRHGLSTGSCAAAAAKAAVRMLARGVAFPSVTIRLPDGFSERLEVIALQRDARGAEATVVKDGGDDPDVTHKARVIARVRWRVQSREVDFRAGEGVGTVTRPGLSIPPGEPAINPVPRRMIAEAVREITGRGVTVTLSVPGGVALAAKTFNPRLGIQGGISILGTSGRVRPFSTPAMEAAIKCHFDVTHAGGIRFPVLVPGAIGRKAALGMFPVSETGVIEVGNAWGFALDTARRLGFDEVLLVGHPGKLAKLAEGHFDTHSKRSPSPLPCLERAAAAMDGSPIAPAVTVEGFFNALPDSARHRFACEVAGRVAVAARNRVGIPASVVLVNMSGAVLGSAGEVSRWA